jgi:DNA-binding protein H-NS
VKERDFAAMSADELWILHEKLRRMLSSRLNAEKHALERRLAQLKNAQSDRPGNKIKPRRRPYPKVLPKYQNPERPSETWSGRGKHPRWVDAQLEMGKKIDDLSIAQRH